MAERGESIIEMRNIVKTYFIGKPNQLEILHGIDLDVYQGEFLAIVVLLEFICVCSSKSTLFYKSYLKG